MNSEWAEHSVGDLFELINGYAFKSSDFKNCGIPVIKIKNVKAGAFIDDNFDFVDPDFLISRSDKQPKQGDLLITMSGNRHDGSRETWVGKVTWFNQGKNYLVNQRVGILRLRDSGGFNARFLAYQLSSDAFQDHFIAVATSSGGQANLSPNQIKEMILRVPGKKIQDQIATILGEIEDKIDLNHRINQTLEAMAQAIFKSWFVDFDPVKAKIAAIEQGEDPLRAAMRAISGKTDAELDQMPREHHDQLAATAALFPDAMQESELGAIPKGWMGGAVGDLAEVTIGGDWGKDQPEDGEYVQAVCLRGVDLEHLRVTGDCPKAPVRWVKKNSIEKRQIQNFDLLIGGSGAGPCGRPLYASPLIAELVDHPVIYSNFVKRFRCKHSSQAIYLEHILWEMFNGGGIQNYINGTSVPNLNDKGLMVHPIVLPESQLLKEFERISQNWFKNLYSQESKTLSGLRDTLLPKLLSGELSVADLEVPA